MHSLGQDAFLVDPARSVARHCSAGEIFNLPHKIVFGSRLPRINALLTPKHVGREWAKDLHTFSSRY